MKHIEKTYSVLALAALFFFGNCSRKVSDQAQQRVSPPFENVNVDFTEKTVDPATGGVLSYPSGTTLTIPANAFVFADGRTVTTPVMIQYREFHNSTQVLLSGIPMKYGDQHFETAGMFEMNGTAGGQQVQISGNTPVQVQMASFAPGSDYSFYYFDETAGKWELRGAAEPEANTRKTEFLSSLNTTEPAPVKPAPRSDNIPVFDLDVNLALYPELKDFSGVVWQYAGDGTTSNPEQDVWVFSEPWSSVKLTRMGTTAGKYSLSLKSRNNQYSTVVAPVLSGPQYASALARFEQKMEAYEEALETRAAQVALVQQQADVLRSFSVNSFGIYNWDRIYKDQNVVRVNAQFRLNQPLPDVDMSRVTVYLLTGNDRAVIPYDRTSWDMFSFNPGDDNKLVAVLPGNRIAVFGNDDFQAVSNLAQGSRPIPYTFWLKVIHNQVVSDENLATVIASI